MGARKKKDKNDANSLTLSATTICTRTGATDVAVSLGHGAVRLSMGEGESYLQQLLPVQVWVWLVKNEWWQCVVDALLHPPVRCLKRSYLYP